MRARLAASGVRLRPRARGARLRGFESLEERRVCAIAAEEQLFVYLLNRARHDPAAYEAEAGLAVDLSSVAPSPPAAVNDKLFASAGFHAEEMATFNYAAHQSAVTGDWPNKMARDAGYVLPAFFPNNSNQIESLAAGTLYETAQEPLDALLVDAGVDPPGHRIHLLAIDAFNADNREIGVGHGANASSFYTNYWAIHLTRTDPADVFLTGVVYSDTNQNGRYDLNEGLAGVGLTAHPTSGGDLTGTTNAQGGWSIKAAPGTQYLVSATGGSFAGLTRVFVSVGTSNVEVDFLSGKNQAQVNFGAPENLSPLAVDNTGSVPSGETVSLDVLANDSDPENALNVASLAVVQTPAHGTVEVDTINHKLVYTSTFGYEGSDSFAYTVTDALGQFSRVATVSISVTAATTFPWHNNTIAEDVNGLNGVTNLDAFLLIGEIRNQGERLLPAPTPENGPPLWYDVHADNQFTNIDVFAVIAALRAQPGGEGESLTDGAVSPASSASSALAWDSSLLALLADWSDSAQPFSRRKR